MSQLDGNTGDAEALRALIERNLIDVRTSTPATVVAVRDGGLTVDVRPDISRTQTLDDADVELAQAIVEGVPVFRFGDTVTGLFLVTPLQVGSEGWLLIADRALDAWQYGEGAAPPPPMGTPRHHDLTDAVFYPGAGRNTQERPHIAGKIALTNRAATCVVELGDDSVRVAVGENELIVDASGVEVNGVEWRVNCPTKLNAGVAVTGTGTINGKHFDETHQHSNGGGGAPTGGIIS